MSHVFSMFAYSTCDTPVYCCSQSWKQSSRNLGTWNPSHTSSWDLSSSHNFMEGTDNAWCCVRFRTYKLLLLHLIEDTDHDSKKTFLEQTLDKMDNEDTFLKSVWFSDDEIFPCEWYDKQVKSNPITGLNRPRRFQEAEVPRFQDNRHMKVARLSALRTGRFLPPGNIPGTHLC